MSRRTPTERADACVIGAGPAGALVADHLAGEGHHVVVLEAGPRFDRADDQRRMERSIRPGYDPRSVWEGGNEDGDASGAAASGVATGGGRADPFVSTGDRFYPLDLSRVKGVGGSTMHWQGMVARLHEADFAGTLPNDDPAWPISYDDLRPYYAQAESALGVSGAVDNPFAPEREGGFPLPPFEPSHSDSLFAEACERLGIATHSAANARNSEAYEGRGPCVGYGTCQPVCPSGAKYSADYHVRSAEEAGATVIDRAPVQRLETGDDGSRVGAAVFATPDGEEHHQRAREFVLAAGGVEIPRLLLLSESNEHPDGLANSSGLVGRYFMEHLGARVGGYVDRRTRQHHVGFITTESHQFYDEPGRAVEGQGGVEGDGGSGDDGVVVPATDDALSPIKLEFLNYAGPTPAGIALGADQWGDPLLGQIREDYGNALEVAGLVGQPPRLDNRVTLDTSTTDDHGNPVPDVQWSIGPRVERSVERANEIQAAILQELDAEVAWTVGPHNTGPAFHHMGTTRMGTDPDESVVDPQLRTHDVGNLSIASSSTFVTAGAMNPTLTIAALALKCADHVDERL